MNKQSDIARQFDLPERQSKLNTMLREEGLKDEQVYCVCRSSDVSRFMIGCDHCEEWYHGDCINVTEQEANKIRKFYCMSCRNKHPALQIKYKEKRSHHHHKHKHDKDKDRHKDSNKKDRDSSNKIKTEKVGEKCGQCEACYVREDCGRCEYCKDMTKFGGTGKLRQKCKKRQCQNFFHLAKKHHQSSGTKTNIEKHPTDHSRSDHSYDFQSKVNLKTPSTQQNAGLKPPTTGSLIIKSLSQFSATSSSHVVTSAPSTINCRDTTPPSKPPATLQKISDLSPAQTPPISSLASPLTNLTNSNTRSSPVTTLGTNTTTQSITPIKMYDNCEVISNHNDSIMEEREWEPIKKKRLKETSKKRKEISRKRKPQESGSDSDDPWSSLNNQGPRQCMGPQCVKAARPSSKYCSEDCGLKMAEGRIYSVLPQRIQEWKMTSCVAEEKDRKQLEKIRSQQLEARRALQALDEKHKELDSLLEEWKSVSIDPQADEEGDEEGSDTAFVYCVTCGHEVPTRRAIKHMHSCYNKLESQMSFGSMFKTRIEGNNMFCDAFNASNRTYCKRLRVMCPEHTKESKSSNTEVCGFPLTTDVFTETGRVCRMSKKKCVRHYCWEKLRRANIDMERVRQCLKLDELVEQERQVRLAMTNRAGVLGLMLHSTYDHGYAAKMHHQQQHQQHQHHRQTDHQYHQKDKPPDFNHKQFKESINYHNHHLHKIATDHHYHRQQQQPEGTQEAFNRQASHYNKKYPSKFAPASNSSAIPGNQMFRSKLVQQHHIKLGSDTGGNKFSSSVGTTNKTQNPSSPHQQPHPNEQFYHADAQLNHDHLYFSNQPNAQKDKRTDHLYYSSKRQK